MPEELTKDDFKKVIGKSLPNGYQIKKILGGGAFGIALMLKKENQPNVVGKFHYHGNPNDFYYEAGIIKYLSDPSMLECRTSHIVRLVGTGIDSVELPELSKHKLMYFMMEYAGTDAIDFIYNKYSGDDMLGMVGRVMNQSLQGFYDLHCAGYIYRDFKNENIGILDEKWSVLFDMGICRRYYTEDGTPRLPRSRVQFRGTDEWASLNGELYNDEGRVDDLWGWFYVFVEISNMKTKYIQTWCNPMFGTDDRLARLIMKSTFGPSKFLTQMMHPNAYRIRLYLSTLGYCDQPDYFLVAQLTDETRRHVKKYNRPGSARALERVYPDLEFIEGYMFQYF